MSPRRRRRTRYEAPFEPAPSGETPGGVETAPHAPVREAPPIESPVVPRETRSDAPARASAAAVAAATAEAEAEGVTAETAATEIAPSRPRRHPVPGFLFVLALALVAFATGVLVFNGLVMPRLIHGIGEVEVPDVRNLTLEQAEQTLGPLDLQVSRAGERFDPAVPRGFILSQEPGPGTAVRGRRRVSVVVSLGEEFSSVPALFAESQRSAEQLLGSAGLRLGAITRAPSAEVGEGLVAGSDPAPESVLPQGSAVSLLVSTGSGEESFVMPYVIGREIGGVRRQLEAFGFRVLASPGGGAVGTIVAQRPEAGSRITLATEIALHATGRVIR